MNKNSHTYFENILLFKSFVVWVVDFWQFYTLLAYCHAAFQSDIYGCSCGAKTYLLNTFYVCIIMKDML